MKSRLIRTSIVLIVLLRFSPILHAQVEKFIVNVHGQVEDASGAVVPNARVLLIDLSTLATHLISADSGGRFDFTNLKLAPYEVKAASPGFITGSEKFLNPYGKVAVVESQSSSSRFAAPTPMTVNVKIVLKVAQTT